jgi:hypothetical protein
MYKQVRQCEVCKINKEEHVASPGLLQPLSIPQKVWSDITMDLIEKLPKSEGKDTIMVVVDRRKMLTSFPYLTHSQLLQ